MYYVVPADTSIIYCESNGSDCSPKVLMLAVNRSTEETLCASGRFWLELIFLLC